MKILFINDKSVYNERYRGRLISFLRDKGYDVDGVGLFDHFYSFFCFICYLLGSAVIVSSNLKTNIVFLFFCSRKGVIILNGLGRYRYNRLFRKLLCFLLKVNLGAKYFIVQNYADWRYLKKLLRDEDRCLWFPGSGGSKRSFLDKESFFIVQRKSKVSSVVNSVCSFGDMMGLKYLNVVGCEDADMSSSVCGSNLELKGIGYQKQNNIFKYGFNFVQPDGYGEGFPHTLADAVVTGLNVYMTKKLYVQLGLYVMHIPYDEVVVDWFRIKPDLYFKRVLDTDASNVFYSSVIESVL